MNFGSPVCDARGFERPGVTHERGQDAVCAGHGVRSMDEFFAHRAAPRWRRRGTPHELRRTVPRHGVCAVDLGSESLRDIEVTLGANAGKLYSMGLRHSVHRSTLADANDSRNWRIWSDLAALLIRRARKLYREEDLGLDLTNTVYALEATTDRSVFESGRLGPVSQHQGSREDAHVAGPARLHSQLHSHLRRQAPRRQRPRSAHSRAGFFLCDGPRIPGLRSALRARSGRQFLCHSCQAQHERATVVLCARRSQHGISSET